MCVYCQPFPNGFPPHDLVGTNWEAHIAYKNIGGGMRPTLYVLTEGEENQYAFIPISYCPVCGRKLALERETDENHKQVKPAAAVRGRGNE